MDKLESYLLEQTSLREYITFDQFKAGFPAVNQRLLRAVYQQLLVKDEERHTTIEENLREFNNALQESLDENSLDSAEQSSSGDRAAADPAKIDSLADRLAQKLDEETISLDLEANKLERESSKKIDALNDLRYSSGNERNILQTKQEVDSLINSLS